MNERRPDGTPIPDDNYLIVRNSNSAIVGSLLSNGLLFRLDDASLENVMVGFSSVHPLSLKLSSLPLLQALFPLLQALPISLSSSLPSPSSSASSPSSSSSISPPISVSVLTSFQICLKPQIEFSTDFYNIFDFGMAHGDSVVYPEGLTLSLGLDGTHFSLHVIFFPPDFPRDFFPRDFFLHVT